VGEVGVVVINGNKPGGQAFTFHPGDKIAQMIFLPVPDVTIEMTENLNGSARGSNGFGSTGR